MTINIMKTKGENTLDKKWLYGIILGAIISFMLKDVIFPPIISVFKPSESVIEDITEPQTTATTVYCNIITNNKKDVEWEIYLICSNSKDKLILKGKGDEVYAEDLYPNTKYIIKALGKNSSNPREFTTTQPEIINPTYFEWIRTDLSDSQKIKLMIHNAGAKPLKQDLTCIIRDDAGNFVSTETKKTNISSGQDGVVEFSNLNKYRRFDIYYKNRLFTAK